jgi:hypothetical protein
LTISRVKYPELGIFLARIIANFMLYLIFYIMRTKTIVKNASPVPSFNLSPISEGFRLELRMGNPDFWTKKFQAGKLSTHRHKVKANCEKKRLLAKQNHQKNQSSCDIHPDTPEATSRFIIDYMPLCCEEDLEMMTFSMAKDKMKQAD